MSLIDQQKNNYANDSESSISKIKAESNKFQFTAQNEEPINFS